MPTEVFNIRVSIALACSANLILLSVRSHKLLMRTTQIRGWAGEVHIIFQTSWVQAEPLADGSVSDLVNLVNNILDRLCSALLNE